jgi:hypothetical protein
VGSDEITAMHEIAAPKKSEIDDVAAISRERINIRQRAEHEKAITEPGESKSVPASSITEKKPDNRGSGEKENAPQRRIYNTD